MLAEIITIGDEILIGQIVDTNSVFISRALNKIGVQVYQITSIQDDRLHILEALTNAQKRVDIVVLTGGLGPTKDDITKVTLCDFFKDQLIENKEVLKHVKQLYKKFTNQHPLPENLNQALVPSKATVLKNDFGTAPGMWMEQDNTVYISLPGIPFEMKNLMNLKVLPKIIEKFDCPFIYHKTLLTIGKGESEIVKIIHQWADALPSNIKLAYLPSLGRVRLRLSSKGFGELKIKKEVDKQMDQLHELLNDIAVGYENETNLVDQIAQLFNTNKKTLSVSESCTGGKIAEMITTEPGISSFFRGSLVAYATDTKTSILGINKNTIDKFSVVSKEIAELMAIASNKVFKTDYAIATTGNAGPSKGDADDELGTVHIAIASPKGVVSKKFNFGQPRERVILKTTYKALEMLQKEILKN
ncbi:MAG: CinA family nicotinamide mononucleotide deamidase-related protein [Flavobacteriales bacterium]|nr:MAG: CinA family nicotinamide mononucleotide deamidase-related protein [Flavobacteriales bacterium]